MKRSTKASLGKPEDLNRLYRGVLETANKLESVILNANSMSQLFGEGVISLRQRLKEYCESLLLWTPLIHGRKAEDILWRRCYHDVMQYYKRYKKRMPAEDVMLLQMHLTAGIGHYYNLLLIISKHYAINLKKILPYITLVTTFDYYYNSNNEHKEDIIGWAQQTIHRILIYMGDLARYLYDLEQSCYRELSIRFYDAALIWSPDIGMPFNQLGTLSDSNNYGLDSAYYYMRCLSCDKPFEGAENNLRRVFENNDKLITEMEIEFNCGEKCIIVKKAILQFLKLCSYYWFAKPSDFQSNKNVSPLIQEVLYSFKSAFNLKMNFVNEQKPIYLNSMMTFEVSVITLLIIKRLQELEEITCSNERAIISSMVTFAINFMMSLIECCHQNLKTKLNFDEIKANGLVNFAQGMTKESTPELSPRRALSRLRRRKAAINYDDKNNLSLDVEDDDSELSELEETALSTIDALEIGSDISDSSNESDANNIVMPVISSDDCDDDNSIDAKNIGLNIIESTVLPVEELLDYIQNESFLPTIKMHCDWLSSNHSLLILSSSQLQVYFEEFVDFVNTLISIEERVLISFPSLSEFKWFGSNWIQKYPLPSDLSLSNIKYLKSKYQEMLFDSDRVLTNIEKGFLCIQSVIAFTHFLTDLKNCPNIYGIAYNINEKRFVFHGYSNGARLSLYDTNTWSDSNSLFLSNNSQTINNENENSVNSLNDNIADESKRQKKMMRNMAHLWLKAEVSNLEKDVIGGIIPQLPPYIVLESTVFWEHLDFVKDLAASKRFILVIPKIVLKSLDQEKKFRVNAREAIRWLEEELLRGNRVIKYPKDSEKLSLSPIKYPKRKDKDACDYYELLEYCNYLNNNSNAKISDKNSMNGMPMVTLLTRSFDKWPANAEAVAKTSGVHLESVESFISKWKCFGKANT